MKMILPVLVLSLALVAQACPPAEILLPHCNCRNFGKDNAVFCSKLLTPDELIGPIRKIAMGMVKIFSIQIQNSTLQYIPGDLFKDTGIQKIRFFATELLSLSDSDLAFEGLEDSLTELRATDSPFIAQWDWQQLRNLKKIDLIDVNYVTLGAIEQAFPELPNLQALGIIRAEISSIVDNAFAELPQLTIFNMKQNLITDVKRNMLPDPADSLRILDLSNNKLSKLPEDFFSNMPGLQDVHLDNNQFLTLPENVFSWVMMNIRTLTMTGNEIRCDCRIRWLADARTPFIFAAKCASPENLAGTELKHLQVKQLWC